METRLVPSKRASPRAGELPEGQRLRHLPGEQQLGMLICQEAEGAIAAGPEQHLFEIHCQTETVTGVKELSEIIPAASGEEEMCTTTYGGSSSSSSPKSRRPPTLSEFKFDLGSCENVKCVDTGVVIPAKPVLEARQKELEEMRNFRVWHYEWTWEVRHMKNVKAK